MKKATIGSEKQRSRKNQKMIDHCEWHTCLGFLTCRNVPHDSPTCVRVQAEGFSFLSITLPDIILMMWYKERLDGSTTRRLDDWTAG